MPFETDAVWTALVLLFWFWPLLLAIAYAAAAGSWAVVRLVRENAGLHAGPAEHPAPSGGS